MTLTTSAAAADLIEIEVAASGLSRKITKANFIGATLTGGGSIVTGGYTLTVPKTGTVPVGTGTDGRVAQWSGDANTLAASTLAKTGAGVLTLSAAGAYTLTVPATGTAVLLDASQTLTNKTLTTPTIGSFTNAQHNHTNAAGGGQLTTAALSNLSTLLQTTGDQSASGVKTLASLVATKLRLGSAAETISGGSVPFSASLITLDTEGGAGTDDLTTVTGGSFGDILCLRITSASRTVTIKDGTGNFQLPSDRLLDFAHDTWLGVFNGVWWCELNYANNA
ncbi:MAG: hypothetical protein KDE58_30890 [Caldilineaceae bacterium]|nr:hypothetical protein [Caldilineaceae bacterium]